MICGMRALACLVLLATSLLAQDVERFRVRSDLLSKFWKRDMYVEAGIVLPPNRKRKALAACYNIHGFGGSWRFAYRRAKSLIAGMKRGYPRMIYVYLQAQFHLGHHEFADSANNGPWGEALTTEFIPALEAKYGADPKKRFLTGHSSGGWSSLWLQVAYPDFFSAPGPRRRTASTSATSPASTSTSSRTPTPIRRATRTCSCAAAPVSS